ncbi:MAG: DUF5004 domain-containing protein [Sediminicola sp.]|tara:strand:+ start:7867 stop:8394 length:528 start_codon:yes stop_codon:yes gene_type:complete
MKRILFLLTLALMGFTATSCNSDDDSYCVEDFTGALTEDEAVLVGTWELTAITSDEEVDITDDDEDNPSEDIFAQQDECQNDVSYSFSSNRAYTLQQATNVSGCDAEYSTEGTWNLVGDEIGLVDNCNLQILEVAINTDETAFSFVVDQNIRDVDGAITQVQLVITYTKVVADPA